MADPQVAAAGGLAPPSAPQAAAPAPVPTSAAAPVQVPFWESAGRSFGLGATRASATLPFLGGGLAAQTGDALDAAHRGLDWLSRSGMPGASTLGNASDALEHGARWAQDKSDQLFDVSQQVRAAGDDEYGPRGNERFNRWGQIAGQLPVGLGTFPLQTAERAQDLSDQGVPADAAQRAVLADTAFNTATAALPAAARGGWLTRAATGGVIGTGTSVAGRQAERLALGDDAPADVSSQPVFDTGDVIGGVLGVLVGGRYGARREAVPREPGPGSRPLERPERVSPSPDPTATEALHDPNAIEVNDEEPEHLEARPVETDEPLAKSPSDDGDDRFDWDSGVEVNEEEPERYEASSLENESHLSGEEYPGAGIPVNEEKPEHVTATELDSHGISPPGAFDQINAADIQSGDAGAKANTGQIRAVGNGIGDREVGPNRKTYSVAVEVQLDPQDYGKSRRSHKILANDRLSTWLEDPEYFAVLDQVIPNVQSLLQSDRTKAPEGWSWEHASTSTASGRKGVIRLVPSYQHTPGSPWWRALHPDKGGRGGYSEWAIPAGAPPNRRSK